MYGMGHFRWLWFGLGVLLLAVGGLWLASGFMRPLYYGGYYRMPMMGWGGGGWMLGMGLIGFVFICFLVMAVFRFSSWGRGGYRGCGVGRMGGRSSGAEEILRQRYARGEISGEQYEQMLRELRS